MLFAIRLDPVGEPCTYETGTSVRGGQFEANSPVPGKRTV